MDIPRIGLSLDQESVSCDQGSERYYLKRSYVEATLECGGAPVLLPPTKDPAVLRCLLEPLSALVITGGDFDIPPDFYGSAQNAGSRRLVPERSDFERQLLRVAWERRLPVLGVCGGMQLLNVFRGGTLVQHVDGHEGCEHAINIQKSTLLHGILQSDQCSVNSTHHQAIGELAADLLASARAPDGIIEAIEWRSMTGEKRFFLGVQWHPEALVGRFPQQLKIYQSLIEAARQYSIPT